MSVLTTLPPALPADVVAASVREHFELAGTLTPLESERDQNFRLEESSGRRWVVKVANAAEAEIALDLQGALLRHAAESAPALSLPRLRLTTHGDPLAVVDAPDGARHFMRVVSWVDGEPFATAPRSVEVVAALGTALGTLAAALRGFAHPGAIRDFDWDVTRAARSRERLRFIGDAARRAIAEHFLDRFEHETLPALRRCRAQVIHGDANDYNVLVGDAGEAPAIAVIDFGDAVHSPLINEVAVACAYAMLGSDAPIERAAALVAAFHAVTPLEPGEVDLLYDLIAARLVISVTMSAARAERVSDNAYLGVSERPAWEMLARLREMDPVIVAAILRQACGMEAHDGTRVALAWIGANARTLSPVMHPSVARQAKALVPFGDPSHPIAVATAAERPDDAERIWDAWAREHGISLGIGPYGEERSVYTAPGFASKLERVARRSVHLGLDLFAPAGTAVHAPLDGRVVDVYQTDFPLDYGHAVLLEHTPAPGVRFYTLWGHLAAEILVRHRVGAEVRAGDVVALLGAPHENGGWQPHLHLQLVMHRPVSAGDVIGVGEPKYRAVWSELYPDPSTFAGLPPEALHREGRASGEIVSARRESLLRNLSISYRQPLKIVRGEGVHLYDDRGRAYLDCYNNVAHLGHAHPEVVEALARQAARLNTNTRYLNDLIVEYAEALTRTLPESLTVAAFVCSGSEANDLALRLARHYRRGQGVIALDWAYHGHATSLIEVSPYKYKRKGGTGRPATTGEAMLPDPYRAPADWPREELAARYAASVSEAAGQLRAGGHAPAAFIAESLPSTAGQIVLPEGYLPLAYAAARDVGAVVIADEVQVGFGRVGTRMWGFAAEGAVPDIVTMGKPIGNAHPMAALVTTREIADDFNDGMEYFNTFGGNPVSCAVGLTVLRILERDRLLENAREVGDYIVAGMRTLMERHAIVGDVRGRGLMLGMELVEDRTTKVPATARAGRVAERCKELGVLLGTDGPWDNVIKMRPAMVFSRSDADYLLQVLGRALEEVV